MIHETTQRPHSENVSPDTCILETTGLRGSSIRRENNLLTYSKVTQHFYNQGWLFDEILEMFLIWLAELM